MLVLPEDVVMSLVLLIMCVVDIANGPVGVITFYELEVQKRTIELGSTCTECDQQTFPMWARFTAMIILLFWHYGS